MWLLTLSLGMKEKKCGFDGDWLSKDATRENGDWLSKDATRERERERDGIWFSIIFSKT